MWGQLWEKACIRACWSIRHSERVHWSLLPSCWKGESTWLPPYNHWSKKHIGCVLVLIHWQIPLLTRIYSHVWGITRQCPWLQISRYLKLHRKSILASKCWIVCSIYYWKAVRWIKLFRIYFPDTRSCLLKTSPLTIWNGKWSLQSDSSRARLYGSQ